MAVSMNEFNLTISTPAGTVFEGRATQVSVRGTEGELAVLAGHIPFVTALVPAECRIYLPDGSLRTFKCGGGLINVSRVDATPVDATPTNIAPAGAAPTDAAPTDNPSGQSTSIEVIILSSEAEMNS